SGQSALDCPETALLCAVLEDAFACLDDAQHPELRDEALRWHLSKSHRVFTFVALCEPLSLVAGHIRAPVADPARADTRAAVGARGTSPRAARAAENTGARATPTGGGCGRPTGFAPKWSPK